jgi:polysaccharide biosynthesis/export protein
MKILTTINTCTLRMKYNLRILTFLIAAVAFTACVPNKKVAYLQYKNEYDKPETIVKDTLIRKYETGQFSYKLQPGDLLDIKISTLTPKEFNPFNDADPSLLAGQQIQSGTATGESSIGYYIDPDGVLTLPLLGSLKVIGFTLIQLGDSLQARTVKYLEKPVVRVRVQNYRYTVLGEVNTSATLLTYDNSLTMLQAIGKAGGISEFGDLSRVKVVRRFDKQTYVFYVNLLNEEFLSSPFYFVQPNDVITVTPVKQRSYLKYVSPNLAIFTATTSLLISIFTLITLL